MSSPVPSSCFPSGPAVLAAMIAVAALSRLLPHPPNFSPLEAIALFGGAYFLDRRLALLVPLLAMLVSDVALALLNGGLYLGYFFSLNFAAIYLCIALCALLGFGLHRRVTGTRVLGYSLSGSLLFFLLSNFAVWLTADAIPGYDACRIGLASCYAAALPFFQWSVLGTLFYSALLFGGFAWLRRKNPRFIAQTA